MAESTYYTIFSEFQGDEGDVIPVLQKIQEHYGYISEESVNRISRFLKISENKIFGVASFYSQFRFSKPSRHTIKVCMGTACHVRGGSLLIDGVGRELGIQPGETTHDNRFDFQRVVCLGCCALAPVIQIDDEIIARVSINRLGKILAKYD